RVVAPSPVLPRRAAAPGVVDGRPVPAGARLLLVVRHGALAHRRDIDPADPAPPATARLVFGAGPHACPGAALARALLEELLAELAPHRPVVTRARADRHAALPGWRSLVVRAGPRSGKGREGRKDREGTVDTAVPKDGKGTAGGPGRGRGAR
ncbi:cytochrome P450, partial [Streptomyces sp. ST2-7A]|nr:cytochrome P450 [Streptomyces sp. ST2-7A]